mgnify:CR=1 FL=1
MTRKKKDTIQSQAQALFLEPGLMKELFEQVVRNLLEEEVSRFLGAEPYERSSSRRGSRNGTKPRTMKTSVGELEFGVPQVREGGFRTQLFDRWQRSDKALVAAMQEMVVKGVSTRRVSDVLEEMGGFEVSAATVSKTMSELDASIEEFFSRKLTDARYPYLMVDARYEKVRKNGRVRTQAVLIAAGVTEQGRRELLSVALGDSESLDTWGELFKDLKRRGLSGVRLLVSDAHEGIRAAFEKHFQGALWQRCRVHFMREMLAKVGSKDRKEMAEDMRSIYASDERGQCLQVAEEIADKWGRSHPKVEHALRDGVEDTLTVWDFDRRKRRKLNSTNMLERLMKEIKARTKKIGSFPNERSCWRLIGALLLETQDNWDVEPRRYIVMDD